MLAAEVRTVGRLLGAHHFHGLAVGSGRNGWRTATVTDSSQQFVADGMKIDLSRQMVTVTDDPQAKPGVVQGFTVEQYWSTF